MATFSDAKDLIREIRDLHFLIWRSDAVREGSYFGGLYPALDSAFGEFAKNYTIAAKSCSCIPRAHMDGEALPDMAAAAFEDAKRELGAAQANFDVKYGVAYAG